MAPVLSRSSRCRCSAGRAGRGRPGRRRRHTRRSDRCRRRRAARRADLSSIGRRRARSALRCTCSRAPGSRAACGSRCRCSLSSKCTCGRRSTHCQCQSPSSGSKPGASLRIARQRTRSRRCSRSANLFLDDDAADRQRILVAQVRLDGDRVGEDADVDAAVLGAEAAVAHLDERVTVVGREDRIHAAGGVAWESASASPPGSRRARRSPPRSARSTPSRCRWCRSPDRLTTARCRALW